MHLRSRAAPGRPRAQNRGLCKGLLCHAPDDVVQERHDARGHLRIAVVERWKLEEEDGASRANVFLMLPLGAGAAARASAAANRAGAAPWVMVLPSVHGINIKTELEQR